MGDWIEACGVDDVPEGGCTTAAGAVIVKLDGELHAVGARCPHMGYPMNKGTLRDGVITCAWHKWEFDLRSGGCYRGACDDLPVYPLRIVDGMVEIQVRDAVSGRVVEKPHRGVSPSKLVSPANKVKVLFDWLKNRMFGRDVSRF